MTAFAKPPCDEALILSAPCAKRVTTGGGWILATTILGFEHGVIDSTVVKVALPAVQSGLNAPISQVQWIVEAYA